MDIHKPHAAKSWGEFFIELGTVVLGIVIALGLEQAVEAVHHHAQAREANETIAAEIRSDLTRMQQRTLASGCVDARLAELDAIVDAAGPDGRIRRPSWIGRPPRYAIEWARWEAAASSGRVSLLPSERQSQLSLVYTMMRYYYDQNNSEEQVWSRLEALAGVDRLTPDGQLAIKADIAQARFDNWSMRQVDAIALGRAARLGLGPTGRRDPPFSVCWPITTPTAEGWTRLAAAERSAAGR